ncbi:MAG TPA: hypothetical protein DEP24_00900 [Mycobacterium sp.]|nr:hypothetical protein [Mycobacterium sp.]
MFGLSLGSLAWKAAPWLAILMLCGVLWGVWGWKEAAEAAQLRAEEQLAVAVRVNKDNEVARLKLERQLEADRRLSAAEIEAANLRKKSVDTIKKEHRVAPDSNDPISNYDLDHFDRLRQP